MRIRLTEKEILMNFYVYCLKDPTDNSIFYIGKGKRYRSKTHLKESLWKTPEKTTNPLLYNKIKSLMLNNTAPIIEILYKDLEEEDAYNIEKSLIQKYKRKFFDEDGILLNISNKSGPNSGHSILWSEDRKQKHKEKFKSTRVYDPTYEELFAEFVLENKTRKEISKNHECSEVLVKKRLTELGIKKPKGQQYPPKQKICCKICNKNFVVANKTKRKYCSKKCYDDVRGNNGQI